MKAPKKAKNETSQTATHCSVLWTSEGTRTTLPLNNIQSGEPTLYEEVIAKFKGQEYGAIILKIGQKELCDDTTKHGAEKDLIMFIKDLQSQI